MAVMAESFAAGMGLGQCFAIVSSRAGQHLALSLASARRGFAVLGGSQGQSLGITQHISRLFAAVYLLRQRHGSRVGFGVCQRGLASACLSTKRLALRDARHRPRGDWHRGQPAATPCRWLAFSL